VEYTIQAWRKDIGNLSTLQPPPNVQRFLLDTASEIATTPGLDPVAKQIGPQDNSARFHFESTDSGFEQVDFGFLWQNPSDQPALVNVDGYLILNGLCQVLVSGDFFGISSGVEIRTFLRIHQLWNSPPTSPAPQSSQFQRALQIDLDNPGPFSGGEISSENLFRGFDLQYSSFMVPPLAPAGFEMLCEIFYYNDRATGSGCGNPWSSCEAGAGASRWTVNCIRLCQGCRLAHSPTLSGWADELP
jgi:hypothetical protein